VPIASFLPATVDYARFLPEILLTLAGTMIMFLEALRPEGKKSNAGVFAIVALVMALPAALMATPGPAFQGMLVVDGMATFFRTLVIVCIQLVLFIMIGFKNHEIYLNHVNNLKNV